MQFTTTLIAIFATVALAAPSAEVTHQSALDIVQTITPDALARYEAGIVSPSVAARGVDTTLDKRDITHLFVCTDANFSGKCQNLATDREVCHFLGNGFDNSISSLGPDNDGTQCCIFEF
ncbi:hypothetical protein M7I_1724 [Glarea lozoyensis 74030]|uniref:Uncharacterized protein n=1 Tax=Glarea lozoyensis (strain ATCC 74030 / MF5533) TaxID=1104152 RepID=H0EGZ2_GLAL7|nr:hypothetical protein M7I_1724 [Glarea lozoyensis 74030]